MRKLFRLLPVIFLLLLCNGLYAQQKTVTGVVTDDDGNKPLPGVSVSLKGNTRGTQNQFFRSFTIQAAKAVYW